MPFKRSCCWHKCYFTKDSDTTGNGVNDITYEMYKDPGADKYFLVAVNNTYSNIGQQSFTISGLNIADGFQATVFDEQASGSFSFSISEMTMF